MERAPSLARATPAWLATGERGTALGIHLAVLVATSLGRPAGRLLARAIALYYLLAARDARSALRSFYRHLDGRDVDWPTLYRHLARFALTTLDALFFVSGRTQAFDVTRTGHAHLVALRAAGRGALLVGAHIGSFQALRMASRNAAMPLVAVVHTKNARVLQDALSRLDPEGATQLLELGYEGGPDVLLTIRDRIERGELVALLADRLPPHAAPDRVVRAPFLGEDAPFPAGPFLLAAALRCPVYLVFGLSRGSHRYDLFCEPFAERIELPRRERSEALATWVARYAARVEHHVREAPDNWFNFYDFWSG